MFLDQPLLDHLAELGQQFQAERLGEFVAERDRLRRFDRLHGDIELGILAGQMRRRIDLREGHVDGALLARRHADQLVLEARDECARSEMQRDVAAGAALERRAVHLAGEIDGDAVAVFGLGALALGGKRPALFGDAGQGLVDLGLGDLGVQPFELDALEIRELDRRQYLDRHRIGEIALAFDDLLDRALLGRQGHLRLAHELEAALGNDLGVRLAHRRFDHLGHHRAPIQALEVCDRDLARTEAVDADLILELAELGIGLGGQIGCGDHDLELALEAVADSFGYLHHHNLLFVPLCTASKVCPLTLARFKTRDGLARRGAGGGT